MTCWQTSSWFFLEYISVIVLIHDNRVLFIELNELLQLISVYDDWNRVWERVFLPFYVIKRCDWSGSAQNWFKTFEIVQSFLNWHPHTHWMSSHPSPKRVKCLLSKSLNETKLLKSAQNEHIIETTKFEAVFRKYSALNEHCTGQHIIASNSCTILQLCGAIQNNVPWTPRSC